MLHKRHKIQPQGLEFQQINIRRYLYLCLMRRVAKILVSSIINVIDTSSSVAVT